MLYLISVDNVSMIYSGGDTPEDAIKAVEYLLGEGRQYTVLHQIDI